MVNSKKWPGYTIRVICGLGIFFFRKINNTIMRDFAILFTKNLLKQPPKKLDQKTFFFYPKILSGIIQRMFCILGFVLRLKDKRA